MISESLEMSAEKRKGNFFPEGVFNLEESQAPKFSHVFLHPLVLHSKPPGLDPLEEARFPQSPLRTCPWPPSALQVTPCPSETSR